MNAGKKKSSSELLSRREVAMHLGVAEQTLAIWQTTGRYKLPMVKVGRLAKYRLTDLEKFPKKRTIGEVDQESTSAAPNTVKDSPGRNMPVRFRGTNHHTLQSSVKQESGGIHLCRSQS